jgi:hypothetical protein
MEYAINGLSLVTAPNLASTAVRRLQSVSQSRRWQPAEAEFLFTGRAAFRKLQRIVAEFSRTADDSSDVVVVLLPQNAVVRKIQYTEAETLFVCDGRSATVSIPNGRPFGAFIEVVEKRNHARVVTDFVDQLPAR